MIHKHKIKDQSMLDNADLIIEKTDVPEKPEVTEDEKAVLYIKDGKPVWESEKSSP